MYIYTQWFGEAWHINHVLTSWPESRWSICSMGRWLCGCSLLWTGLGANQTYFRKKAQLGALLWWKTSRCMMTSSNGNIFRVTGLFCGEFTGHRCIPNTKASDAELWCMICAWTNSWANNADVGDLKRHRAHYDVIESLEFITCMYLYVYLFVEYVFKVIAWGGGGGGGACFFKVYAFVPVHI